MDKRLLQKSLITTQITHVGIIAGKRTVVVGCCRLFLLSKVLSLLTLFFCACSLYSVHRVEEVNQEFIDRLQTNSMNIHVFVSPYIASPPQDKISTQNAVVAKNMGFNVGADLSTENELLREKVALLEKENTNLKEQLKKLSNGPASAIGSAQAKDAAINK